MNRYWFQRRKGKGLFRRERGWGYTPITWEGMALSFSVVLLFVGGAFYFDIDEGSTERVVSYLLFMAVVLVLFFLFARKKSRD